MKANFGMRESITYIRDILVSGRTSKGLADHEIGIWNASLILGAFANIYQVSPILGWASQQPQFVLQSPEREQ